MSMASLDDYPNLIDNSSQSRCGSCNAFTDGSECWRCGQVQECHCGEYRPVLSEHTGRDGKTYWRLRCDCNGVSKSWVYDTNG